MIKKTLEEVKKIYSCFGKESNDCNVDFETMIPKECRKCGLLEKDIYRKTIKCIYRTKTGCMLGGNNDNRRYNKK